MMEIVGGNIISRESTIDTIVKIHGELLYDNNEIHLFV